jgi:hypothetical protein
MGELVEQHLGALGRVRRDQDVPSQAAGRSADTCEDLVRPPANVDVGTADRTSQDRYEAFSDGPRERPPFQTADLPNELPARMETGSGVVLVPGGPDRIGET